jgi:hypothetical protein
MQIHARSPHGSVLLVKPTNEKARLRNAKLLCLHNAISTSLTPDTDSAAKGGVRVLGASTSVPFRFTLHRIRLNCGALLEPSMAATLLQASPSSIYRLSLYLHPRSKLA